MAVPLSNYLEQISAEQGTIPTEEQYDQLDVVAKDSSEVIRSEVCLLDLDLIKDRPVFQQVLHLLQNVRDALVPSVLLLTFCTIGIFLLKRKWRFRLETLLVGFWISGVILMVPTLVPLYIGRTKRLAISTSYLKYFVDSVLTEMNMYFLVWGASVFLLTSAGLCVLKWTDHPQR